MLLIIELVGAIGLLLFELRQVRNGIMRAFRTSLKRLARRTKGRVLPTFLAGLLVAVLLQSSAATAMISATFAAQGAISAATAFIIILGADIGTSIAALIASQKITAVSPLLIAVGYFGDHYTLARVKLYHFTVFGFNSGQRTNEVAVGDNCRGMDTFALEKVDEPVRPFQQNLFRLN